MASAVNSFLLVLFIFGGAAGAEERAPVAFSILPTASLQVREALVHAGGSFSKKVTTNFSAILVQHGESTFLFDTGLGRDVARQYQQDMPRWQRPFFKYDEPVDPARAQLDRAGMAPVGRIILSHSHWDHASGVLDFPGAEVWVPAAERAFIAGAGSGVGAPWPSQLDSKEIAWRTFEFSGGAFEGFASSLDVYGDATVVLVPLPGHTPGSVGMFLTLGSGRRFFFSGDLSWSLAALEQERPKFWAARWLVDNDAAQTASALAQVHGLMLRHPDLTVVPAHDGALQARLGYFPQWLR